jgi:hypothetical protein
VGNENPKLHFQEKLLRSVVLWLQIEIRERVFHHIPAKLTEDQIEIRVTAAKLTSPWFEGFAERLTSSWWQRTYYDQLRDQLIPALLPSASYQNVESPEVSYTRVVRLLIEFWNWTIQREQSLNVSWSEKGRTLISRLGAFQDLSMNRIHLKHLYNQTRGGTVINLNTCGNHI